MLSRETEPQPRKWFYTIRGRENIDKYKEIQKTIWDAEVKQGLPLTSFAASGFVDEMEVSVSNFRAQSWLEDGFAKHGIKPVLSSEPHAAAFYSPPLDFTTDGEPHDEPDEPDDEDE